MAALVTIHNDGPDAAMVRIGPRWVRLEAGESTRTNATHPLEIEPLPKVDPTLLKVDLGIIPGKDDNLPPCQLASD